MCCSCLWEWKAQSVRLARSNWNLQWLLHTLTELLNAVDRILVQLFFVVATIRTLFVLSGLRIEHVVGAGVADDEAAALGGTSCASLSFPSSAVLRVIRFVTAVIVTLAVELLRSLAVLTAVLLVRLRANCRPSHMLLPVLGTFGYSLVHELFDARE